VLDPFVGTGSLLVEAAVRGALCVGIDLDGRVITGSGVGKLNKKSPLYSYTLTRAVALNLLP
jgi:tRNA G10  N-methylase Trm11